MVLLNTISDTGNVWLWMFAGSGLSRFSSRQHGVDCTILKTRPTVG